MVLGPSVLGWVEADLVVSIVAVLGLAFLLFLAGLEIDTRRLRGPLLRLALVGYGVTLTLGLAVGGGLDLLGWVSSPVLVAVALSATSLGLIVPVLKDARKLESGLGQTAVAAASVADFTAIVLLSLFFSTSGSGTGARIALLVLFSGLVSLTAVAALAVGRLHRLFRTKREALGYGFLIPVLFIASGLLLVLAGLVDQPSALAWVPVLAAALLVVRGVPALLFVRRYDGRSVAAAGLLQATSLPFLVTAGQIGVATGTMTETTAAALVCSGLVSVVAYPALALGHLRNAGELGETEHRNGGLNLASPELPRGPSDVGAGS